MIEEGQSPGFKFNDWECVRAVGWRSDADVDKNNAVLRSRDVLGRKGKQFVSRKMASSMSYARLG